jgi:hypothetical protein
MGTVKETIKASTKGGKKLGLFQKFYKQYLKFFTPKEAKIAAEKAAKEAKDKIIDKKVADAPKTIKKIKKKALIGAGGLTGVDVAGYGLTGESPIIGPTVQKIIPGLKKGGYVKMKRGGSVKKRAKSSSKKSRGTGAAIKGTKFKGVF